MGVKLLLLSCACRASEWESESEDHGCVMLELSEQARRTCERICAKSLNLPAHLPSLETAAPQPWAGMQG